MQAVLVLILWGYIHFTYIVSSEDCLVNTTERPFPRDVILQVEVYSNTSEIWNEREKALLRGYNALYRNQVSDVDSRELLSTIWIRDYCESNMIVNLTGTNYFCQLILAELVDFSELEYSVKGNRGSDTSEKLEEQEEVMVKNSCARKKFSDFWITKKVGVCVPMFNTDRVTQLSVEEDESTKATFYSKNYTLFDLFLNDLYST